MKPTSTPEWTILASILEHNILLDTWTPVTIATGLKCLPESRCIYLRSIKEELGKAVLRDMHAEIIAIKAFRVYLMNRSRDYTDGNEYWLYISTVPCGDASTLSDGVYDFGNAQDPLTVNGVIRGRSAYGQPGLCRTKPARADAPSTHCMSCSDKLARWCCIGIQGTELLKSGHNPIYLMGIVVGGENKQYHDAINRALNIRTPNLEVGIFKKHILDIKFTNVKFNSDSTLTPSNTAIVWWKGSAKPEYIVDGFKQGACIKYPLSISPKSYSIIGDHKFLSLHTENISSTIQRQYEEAKTAFHSSPPFNTWIRREPGSV